MSVCLQKLIFFLTTFSNNFKRWPFSIYRSELKLFPKHEKPRRKYNQNNTEKNIYKISQTFYLK